MSVEQKELVDLSITVTFHNEGIIAHKRMLNLFEMVKPLEREGITYEMILHIDNGDAATIEYLSRYKDYPSIRIFQNSFGNPSDSRNFCAEQAAGKYLAVLDGDDLMSNQWLIDGYHILEQHSDPVVLHAEIDFRFGSEWEDLRIWHMSDSYSDDEDTLNLFTRNRWSAGTMLSREVALRFPYKKSRQGFGYEDWTFNMDTRAVGIRHLVVPRSVQFYRAGDQTTSALHNNDNAVTYYSELFDTDRMKALCQRIEQSPVATMKNEISLPRRALRAFYNTVCTIPGARKIVGQHLNGVQHRLANRKIKDISDFFLPAWRGANAIDGELWPSREDLRRLVLYSSDLNYLGVIYCKLIAKMRRNPDYVFLSPQLSVGGTEKVIANYLKAFAKLHPDWHIVVLSSIPEHHPFNFPDNVDFLNFFEIIHDLENWERDFILSRFIVQTKVKRLHIIHNDLAFRWVKAHLDLLTNNDYKVYISQFMYEYNKDSSLHVGFVDPYIRNIYPAITKILTDNTQIIDEMTRLNAFSPDKMSVNYQPIELPKQNLLTKEPSVDHQPFRVLWASRVAEQKRPDILKRIGKKLDPNQYSIDVYGRYSKPYDQHYFDSAPAIHYKGTYNGIESLDLSQYDAFLYTSQTDGLPNVLLEICSYGLPVVASNVGGVSDLIQSNTGVLVEMEDIDGYIEGLRNIKENPQLAHKRAQKAYEIVKKRHTFDEFLKQVAKDIN